MPDYIYLLQNRLSAAQRNAVDQVRQVARAAGLTVFLAGGAVRDLTSGFPVRDLDFTVQGDALLLKKSLQAAGGELWGEHKESKTLFFWFPGSVRVEVASARREEYLAPGKVAYHWASMAEDLRRRDFTVNAMALSLNDGSYGLLLDPLNGTADIEARHLRLVSNYGFIEDPSRLVRATRLAARTGWQMDERTLARYENARQEELIGSISAYRRGYELEEIGHEEDALRILTALEAAGWMTSLFPAWTVAKVNTAGLEELHRVYVQLLMQGVHPDLSAAQMHLLTAKLAPKELAELKALFPCSGFVAHWEKLEEAAKEFATRLTSKETATPSVAWKLIANHQPEPVLWLAFTSKQTPVQARFKNFFEVWPEARQRIPAQLMAEMRITPELPDYATLLNELFFGLIDGLLETEEALRTFLEPYSPPAPPPPVTIRRTRGRRAAKVEIEEEDSPDIIMPSGYDEDEDENMDEDSDADREEEHEDEEEEAPSRPSPVASKPVKAGKPAPQKAGEPVKADSKAESHKAEPKVAEAKQPEGKAQAKSVAKPAVAAKQPAHNTESAEKKPVASTAKPAGKAPTTSQAKAPAKTTPPVKTAAKPAAKPVATPKSAGKPLANASKAKPEAEAPARTAPKSLSKESAKDAAAKKEPSKKVSASKPAAKPAAKPATKVAAKPAAKKPVAKPAAKPTVKKKH